MSLAIFFDIFQFWVYTGNPATVLSQAREIGIIAFDLLVLLVTIPVCGFQWLTLPTLIVEAIPGLYLFPT